MILVFISVSQLTEKTIAQVQIDRFYDLDEIPQQVIDERRSELINAGFMSANVEELTSFSSGSNSLLQFTFYSNKSFTSVTSSTRGIEFNPNGTRLYVVGRSSNNVIEYHLSTPWDIRTASYQRELDTASVMESQTQPQGNTHGIYIRQQDGLKMWLVNRTEIWEFTLSSAWNISTATPTGYRDLTNIMLRAHDVDFKPDGSVMYMEDRFLGAVFQFNLTSPWDIETSTLDHTFNVQVQQDLQGIQFYSDGTRMFLIDNSVFNGLKSIHEFTLTLPYDLRSATYIGSFSIEDTPKATSLKFSPDFRQLFVSDPESNRIFMYDILSPPDAQLSTITALSERVQANNESTSRIRVIARDSNGQPLEKLPVQLIAKSGKLDYSPSSATTNANGEAYFDVRNNRIETVVYSATSLGVELAATTSVRFLGIDPERSLIIVSNNRIQANLNQSSLIEVTTTDEDGNPFASINVELITDGGNPFLENLQSITNSDGRAMFRISSQKPGSTQLKARALGETLTSSQIIQFLGIDPEHSFIEISSNRVQANGNQLVAATVNARDTDNNPFGNVDAELLTDGGSPTIDTSQRITNSNGQAQFKIVSRYPGTTQLGAKVFGTILSDPKVVQFLGIDPETSSYQQAADRIQANGSDQAEILVFARDEDNNPFGNASMELIPDGGSSIIDAVQPVTDSEGVAVFRVSNNTIERISYQARGLGTTLNGSVSIQFIPVAPVALSATDVKTRSFTANWEMVEGAATYFFDLSSDSTFSTFWPGYENQDVGLTTSIDIESVLPGKSYYYRVRATKNDLIGGNSESIRVHTFPEIPVATSATDRNANRFTARWSKTEGAENYRLDISLNPEFSEMVPGYSDLNVGNQLYYNITGLELGTTYYYRVRAEAGPRISSSSNTIAISTLDLNRELSSIEQEQLRTLANGDQSNRITIRLNSSEGIPLEDVQTTITADTGQVTVEEVQSVTDGEGTALFELSSLQAGNINFTVWASGQILDTFKIEFLPNLGRVALGNNYPNPFRQQTMIPVTIPKPMHVELRVYDRLGRLVRTVINEEMIPGYFEIPFSANGLASGTYYIRLLTPYAVLDETMVYIR